jgi:hypothetical protein
MSFWEAICVWFVLIFTSLTTIHTRLLVLAAARSINILTDALTKLVELLERKE